MMRWSETQGHEYLAVIKPYASVRFRSPPPCFISDELHRDFDCNRCRVDSALRLQVTINEQLGLELFFAALFS